jgi:hypothetical protein
MDFVFVTKLDHLYTLRLSILYINKYYISSSIYVVSRKKDFKYYRAIRARNLFLIDEDSLLPNMTLCDLRQAKVPYFPRRAGWYYQQLLKLAVSSVDYLSENYVVVDADTILLKRIPFLTGGKYSFIKSEEYHEAYFFNYIRLLNEPPNRSFSFISQCMIFNRKIVAEMNEKIISYNNSSDTWNWTIINGLIGDGPSLFSEYETYGHFIKNRYPEKCDFIDLAWLRDGSKILGTMFPSRQDLERLKSVYHLVSFEHYETRFFSKFLKYSFIIIYPLCLRVKSFFFWKSL